MQQYIHKTIDCSQIINKNESKANQLWFLHFTSFFWFVQTLFHTELKEVIFFLWVINWIIHSTDLFKTLIHLGMKHHCCSEMHNSSFCWDFVLQLFLYVYIKTRDQQWIKPVVFPMHLSHFNLQCFSTARE